MRDSLFRLMTVALFSSLLSSMLLDARSEIEYCEKSAYESRGGDSHSGRHYAPSRQVDIQHQKLEVTPDFENRSVSGVIRIDFKPLVKSLPEFRLDAVALEIATVEASAPILGWQNTGEELVITFKDSIPADAPSWVRINYRAVSPAHGLYFRTPEMGYKPGDTHLWTQGEMHEARHWFPSYDYPNEKFTTEMICHVKEGMVALSNGRLVSQKLNPTTGLVAWHWLQEKPHANYLVTLCAGYFSKIEDTSGEVPLAFWTPASQIAFAKNSFAGTRDILNFFEKETGLKYPWARYDQVVVDDFTWGGMENTSQTTLVDSTLHPDELVGTRDSLSLVAHELAHQWFGDYVTAKDWSHTWLNEGFATYYDALYHEHAKGKDDFLYHMLGNARSVLGQPNDTRPIVYRAYKDPQEQFDYRAYPKGSWILHMLRNQLGAELYRKCVKTHLERHALGNATTEQFAAIVEELSGNDWDQFFDQYVFHAHHPELKISYSWDERSKMAKMSVQQVQKLSPDVLLFKFPLKIRFKTESWSREVVAQVGRTSEDFHYPLPSMPNIVRVDPDYGLLAQIDFPLSPDLLNAQLADVSDVIGRIQAVEQLGKQKGKSSIEKLKKTLNQDAFWGVRLEAAKRLREIHDEDSRKALFASLQQPDPRVRKQVVEGIASFFQPETPEALAKAVENEKNPDIVAIAIRELSPYPVDKVKDLLLTRLNSSSYKQVLAVAAIEAIRGQRDPVYIEPLMKMLREREKEFTSSGLAQGMNTLATLASDQPDKKAVLEFLTSRVNHPKERVRIAVIRALGTLGDPKAEAVLETFPNTGKGSPIRSAVETSLRQLSERRSPPAELATLRNEVTELQQANREMKKEFEEMKKRFERERASGKSDSKGSTSRKK